VSETVRNGDGERGGTREVRFGIHSPEFGLNLGLGSSDFGEDEQYALV